MLDGSLMSNSSHIRNFSSSQKFRNVRADIQGQGLYNANMARRGIPKVPVLWFLPEWMTAADVQTQADMMEKTGWSKAKMSQLYNAKQDFNSQILSEAARALNVKPYELLMHPEDAMAIRRMRRDALQIAADRHLTFIHEPGEDADSRGQLTG